MNSERAGCVRVLHSTRERNRSPYCYDYDCLSRGGSNSLSLKEETPLGQKKIFPSQLVRSSHYFTPESHSSAEAKPPKKKKREFQNGNFWNINIRDQRVYISFFFLPWGRKRCTIRRGKRDRSGRGNSVWKCPSATKPVEREKKKRKNVKILEEICCCRRQVLIRFGSLVRNVTATWRRNDVWWFRPEFSLFSFTLTTGSARVTATRAVSTAVYRSARADDRHGPEIKNHGDTANSTDLFRLLCFPSLPISFSFDFFKSRILFFREIREMPRWARRVSVPLCVAHSGQNRKKKRRMRFSRIIFSSRCVVVVWIPCGQRMGETGSTSKQTTRWRGMRSLWCDNIIVARYSWSLFYNPSWDSPFFAIEWHSKMATPRPGVVGIFPSATNSKRKA